MQKEPDIRRTDVSVEEIGRLRELLISAEESGDIEKARSLVEKLYGIYVKNCEINVYNLSATERKLEELEAEMEDLLDGEDRFMVEYSSMASTLKDVIEGLGNVNKQYRKHLGIFVQDYGKYLVEDSETP